MQNNKHPNPIFSRSDFEELKNGWLFSFDGNTWVNINVPYCPESALSGIGVTTYIPQAYYKTVFFCRKEDGKRTILHFGAVDYETEVFANGEYVGSHKGGFTPFEFDVTEFCREGENQLFLSVKDYLHDIPSGKQTAKETSYGCFYTRTTGIWQPVWLERVPENRVRAIKFYPNVKDATVWTELFLQGGGKLSVEVFFEGKKVAEYQSDVETKAEFTLQLSEKHLWSVGDGALYDVVIRFGEDEVLTYFGLREVGYQGCDFLLNGKAVFQKFVLDQGYNPNGIYTQTTDEERLRDIELAIRLGFNGSRLHQKVFDPRFLYLCDRKGYMVWGEFASWGLKYSNISTAPQFLAEWEEALWRDFNHPSIVTWCPLNECWHMDGERRDPEYIHTVYQFTKQFDSTRPCVDVSGGFHSFETDLYDFHCYENVDTIKKYLDLFENEDVLDVPLLYAKDENLRYVKGLPVSFSECGGFPFGAEVNEHQTINENAVLSEEAWGYGRAARTSSEFLSRYKKLVELVLGYKKISGFCYTQLYDVEQETNGFYYYDRSDKLTEEEKDEILRLNSLR